MQLFEIAACLWILGLVLCLAHRKHLFLSRLALCLGCLTAILGAVLALPTGTEVVLLPMQVTAEPTSFTLNAAALWLLGFGLFPAFFSCWISGTTQALASQRYWLAGVSCALLGTLGVFGLQDAVSFLIAWELMSLGVALMLLAENKSSKTGASVSFMLGLLEVGVIALLIAFLLLSTNGSNIQFAAFADNVREFSAGKQLLIGVLLLIGFGAKLGLVPFYEWLPKAYSSGSGATGAIASGVMLNAAFFGLMRGAFVWLPEPAWGLGFGVILVFVGVMTAILTILYAFQQSDWRRLLSFSSAENAAISVLTLGVALIFRQEQQFNLAALAGVVALIHLAGHSLAKGTLFIAADALFCSSDTYKIQQNGLLKKIGWLFGVGALFAVMSLSAMPPQAGFVSEWYVFQTIFHGFNLSNLMGRLTLIVAGIGMALTAAIGLATFVKAMGVGLLGANSHPIHSVPRRIKVSVFILGTSILLLAVGMVLWINALGVIALSWFKFNSPELMHDGFLLVPLSSSFAFISPTLLVVVAPLLALIPIAFLVANLHYPIKRAHIWYGGLRQDRKLVATTALTFSNAMHYFYSFVYLAKRETKREYQGKPYFVKRVLFSQKTTALFSIYLFKAMVDFISYLAEKIRLFQSGNLNFYNAIVGALFILILLTVFI